MSQRPKEYWDIQPLGLIADSLLAQRLQVIPSIVKKERERRNIPVYASTIDWDTFKFLWEMIPEEKVLEDLRNSIDARSRARYPRKDNKNRPKKPVGWNLGCTHIYARYRGSAKKRDLLFKLTWEDFLQLSSQPCMYCGKPPTQTVKYGPEGKTWKHNGIDRLDSSKGYIIENCVPCCKQCNYAKGRNTLEEFFIDNDRRQAYLTEEVRDQLREKLSHLSNQS